MFKRFGDWLVWAAECEPVRLAAAVHAILALLVAWGTPITAEQLAALDVALAAIFAIQVRKKVQPAQTTGDGTSSGLSSGPRAALIVMLLSAAAAAGCAPKVVPPTEKAKAAYTATQVSLRVNELQDVIIELHKTKEIPTTHARTIVQFCVDANFVLREAPNGWQSQVLAAWDQTKKRLPPEFPAGESTKLQVLWIGVSSMMEAFRVVPSRPIGPPEVALAY